MTDRPLMSLDDWDALAHSHYAWSWRMKDQPNGISCPACGSQLLDVNRSEILTTAPPKLRIRCSSCSWMGYRLA